MTLGGKANYASFKRNQPKRDKETLKVLPIVYLHSNLKQYRHGMTRTLLTSTSLTPMSTMSWTKALFFRKVCAESRSEINETAQYKEKANEEQSAEQSNEGKSSEEGIDTADPAKSMYFEMLARKFIEQESGEDRVKEIFQKNHKGDSSPEMSYIKLSLLQVFVISFFLKYVPAWQNARREFISENRATVFRTRIEAARRLQDHVSLTAGRESGPFAAKMFLFSAGILFLSQLRSSYYNRSSVADYSIAAGVTGGLTRLSLGPKGFVAGAAVGTVLGTVAGGVVVALMRTFGVTQEDRHLEYVMSKLQMERSFIGEAAFQQKAEKLMEA